MASGNGFVIVPVRIPRELRFLIEQYQNDMRLVSLNAAFRTLLETHPEIDKRARLAYAGLDGDKPPPV